MLLLLSVAWASSDWRDEILSAMVTLRAGTAARASTSTVRPKKRVTNVCADVSLVNGVGSRIHQSLLPICDWARHLQAITSVLHCTDVSYILISHVNFQSEKLKFTIFKSAYGIYL